MCRKILVTGATGQQGRSLIAALRPDEASGPGDEEYHVLALTRNRYSSSAQHLAEESHVTLVQGDLNDRASIVRIFRQARHDASDGQDNGIWGVFMVLAFPGLGQNADAEEAQGKMLTDVACEYGVNAFVYSSALRSGPKYDDQLELSGRAKVHVERHVKAAGDRGLPWVIVRPGFFMENFSGVLGSLAVGLLQSGLKSETRLSLVAAADIGQVVARAFKQFGTCSGRELAIISESLTADEIGHEYYQVTGYWRSYLSRPVGWLVSAINIETKNLIELINDTYDRWSRGDYPELESEVKNALDVWPQRTTFRQWLNMTSTNQESTPGWNGVSLWSILSGRL